MSPWFKRSKEPSADQVEASEPSQEAKVAAPANGPFDITEVPNRGKRLDLGSIWLPARRGLTVRLDVDKATRQPVAVAVSHDASTLRLQAFAAPRSSSLWDQVRQELIASTQESGGQAEEVEGQFGTELAANMPSGSGKKGKQKLRFLGADGPRWFLRGRLSGPAATDEAAARPLREVFSQVVVVRGSEARPPRDLLRLHPPGQGPASPEESEQGEAGEQVFRRGPEITEVR